MIASKLDIPLDQRHLYMRPGRIISVNGPGHTRAQAMTEARKRWKDDGMISSSDFPMCVVWKIGSFEETRGRGHTWEEAFQQSDMRIARLAHEATMEVGKIVMKRRLNSEAENIHRR